jgi:dolichol-phosphate mannosyltransferase
VVLTLPAFNEAANLGPLLTEARAVLVAAGIAHEFVVVDDGSSDSTPQVLRGLAESLPLTVVTHPGNRGLGPAIMSGLREAAGRAAADDDVIVCMDADNTHDPKYIVPMTAKIWVGGYDIVIASRFREGSREVGVPFVRRLISRAARMAFRLFLHLPEVRDYTCGYRAMRARVVREAMARWGDGLVTRRGFACTDELLVKLSLVTRRIGEIPFVLRYDRKRGHSKMPFMRTVWETLKLLVLKQ